MTIRYTLEIAYGNKFVTDADRYRAEAAIDAALVRESITTDEQFKATVIAFVARSECEPHDAALADSYERIRSEGDVALTKDWGDPSSASISLGAHF